MKRTMLVAVVLAALVLGVVAYATAVPSDVVVTARVNPAFSMTLNQNAVNFGALNLGGVYPDSSTLITVKSNKAWDFTKSGGPLAPLDTVLSESTSLGAGAGIAKGVYPITATYTVDLTGDAAYQLDPFQADGVTPMDYSATYTYDAVQQ